MNSVVENRAAYLAWLRRDFPALYRDVVPQTPIPFTDAPSDFAAPSLSGFWDSVGTTFGTVVSNVTNSLPQIASTYAQYRTQRDSIKLNSQRASMGLAPLQYQNGQYVPATNLPYTQSEYALASTGTNTTTLLLLAGVLGLGVVLFARR